MELTKEQIQDLYAFTKKYHVEWYDLQTELVDHLANDIEKIWKENPKLSYIRARNKSYLKFGIFGFRKIIEKKERSLYKKYWLLIWQFFKGYFKLPKIILTLLLIAIIYNVFDFAENQNLILKAGLITTIFIPFILSFYKLISIRLRQRKTKKKWMFEQIVYSYGGFIYLLIHISSFPFKEYNINWSFQNKIIFSVLITLAGIFSYLIIKVIPSKMEETIEKQYPEYKLYKKA